MNILCVVQRFGERIIGGAEFHCRLIAERLAEHHNVEVATTCADNYLTWKNVYPEGMAEENGLRIYRFPVERFRNESFDLLAFRVLHDYSSHSEQMVYLESHGPFTPKLISFLKERTDIDRFIFFSYRYWNTYMGLQAVGHKSILVPTAEHDRTLYLDIHRETFNRPAAIAFNSVEECDLIRHVSGNAKVPGIVVGVGLPDILDTAIDDVLTKHDITEPYFLYLGRIEDSKGCSTLIEYYLRCFEILRNLPLLVFVGKQEINVPDHSRIRILGILSETDKQALLKSALALIMPSPYESLSMVLLEAWRESKAVLCNGKCEVLRGQCRRSNGGLYYRNFDEFFEALSLMLHRSDISDLLGNQGNAYYQKEYNWSTIMSKYEYLLTLDVS
ncbi:glycosyltransferase family 4 protein [bacterium]|nr:glycosyltransferase family 4 protein [candidate division CSSED10-310 bacterium]